jgi:hypothetical protein
LKKQSQSLAFGRKSEARSSKSETTDFDKVNLKKQSQFAADDIAASLYAQDDYGDFPAGETGENKANRSQIKPNMPLTEPSGVAECHHS